MPHRVLEKDVRFNLGRTLIVALWTLAITLTAAAWIVDRDGHRPLIHASLIVGLLAVSVGQSKANLRQRSMCAARLDLAEIRRSEGESPMRRVQ